MFYWIVRGAQTNVEVGREMGCVNEVDTNLSLGECFR